MPLSSDTGSDVQYYQITDHLGSVRVIKDGEGTVLQRFDYYPFGSESRVWTAGTNTPQSVLRYRFGGKEIAGKKVSVSTGAPAAAAGSPYLDFGARVYDPRTAAWLSQDPMAEKYYPISPYAYCAGNPVNLVDPDGKNPIVGALIGAGLDIGIQIATNLLEGEKWYKIDGASVAISAGAGAVGAGFASKIKQAGNLAKMSKAAVLAAEITSEAVVISGAESAAKQFVSDGHISVKETLTDAAIGGGSSLAGSGAKAVKRTSEQGRKELKVLNRQLDRAERLARGNNPRASRQTKVEKAKKDVKNYGDKVKKATSSAMDFTISNLEEYMHYEERRNK